MRPITPEEVGLFTRYIREISGIELDPAKSYLIETRLGGLMVEQGCSSFSELYYKIKTDQSRALEREVIDRITTHETLFFRDQQPFDLLRHKILPELIDARSSVSGLPPAISIWSAACSTGQEIFSIAIVITELLGDLRRYRIRLFGSDISDVSIAKASYGLYNKFEISRGLSAEKLIRYFSPVANQWKICDEIRAMVSFRKHNLLHSLEGSGRFDVVFCRNVAMYFPVKERQKIFENIAGSMARDGCLIIGATETLVNISSRFEAKRHLNTLYYQLKG
ncbi:MAG: chemotaxis protein CheR [Deltaproteobacteria bacterium RIFOXYD12_FULL_57_12]|nr:MAG: chemotaxis protein CheR [Deltaproteobacteria bacterium RIFOXYD12_FULL_57_12]